MSKHPIDYSLFAARDGITRDLLASGHYWEKAAAKLIKLQAQRIDELEAERDHQKTEAEELMALLIDAQADANRLREAMAPTSALQHAIRWALDERQCPPEHDIVTCPKWEPPDNPALPGGPCEQCWFKAATEEVGSDGND